MAKEKKKKKGRVFWPVVFANSWESCHCTTNVPGKHFLKFKCLNLSGWVVPFNSVRLFKCLKPNIHLQRTEYSVPCAHLREWIKRVFKDFFQNMFFCSLWFLVFKLVKQYGMIWVDPVDLLFLVEKRLFQVMRQWCMSQTCEAAIQENRSVGR